MDYRGLFMDYHVLLFMDYHVLLFMDYHVLFMDYHGLPWATINSLKATVDYF